MIFVVLGTQDKPFKRLLAALEKAVEDGVISDEIIVQSGDTNCSTKHFQIRKIIPLNEFNDLVHNADLIICHAGYGILSTALRHNKKVIACARLSVYGEHHNDHQLELLKYYEQKGYILALHDFSKICELYSKINSFIPTKYNEINDKIINLIKTYIDNN